MEIYINGNILNLIVFVYLFILLKPKLLLIFVVLSFFSFCILIKCLSLSFFSFFPFFGVELEDFSYFDSI